MFAKPPPFLPQAPPFTAPLGRGSGGFLGKLPTAEVRPFRGARDTLRLMSNLALGDTGERSAVVRAFTTWVVADVWPKDYLGEIIAIRNVLVQPSPVRPGTPLFKYVNDPRHVEFVKSPQRMVHEINEHGTTAVDCDEIAMMAATMLLQIGREVEFVALGFAPNSLTHVGLRAKEPKSDKWIWIDGVAGPREKEAAQRAQELLIWSLD
jgi:hypothetical protein